MNRLHGNFLVVDNYLPTLDSYKTLIEDYTSGDYRVTLASSPKEALRIVKDQGYSFNLAMVDVRLVDDRLSSDDSGYILAVKFVTQYRIPTILMTQEAKFSFISRARTDIPSNHLTPLMFWDKTTNGDTHEYQNLFDLIEEMLLGRNVFIIHGHDHDARTYVENTIRTMGLNPVVVMNLQTRNPTNTIISNIIENSDVAFVVALLTPDDIGAAKGATVLSARTRENVLFELGFFIGKYGSERVRILKAPEVVLPSDLHGVVYIPFQKESKEWRLDLYHAIKNLGLKIVPP